MKCAREFKTHFGVLPRNEKVPVSTFVGGAHGWYCVEDCVLWRDRSCDYGINY